MPEAPPLVLSGLGRRFSEGWALDPLDLSLESGTLTAVLGLNGSGKTTLLRLIAGVLPPSGGELWIHGVGGSAPLPRPLRAQTSYISQDLELDPELNGRENLLFLARLEGLGAVEADEACARLIEGFELQECLAKRVRRWSGGQRRRLHLAAALISKAPLLLFDEPSAGLDARVRETLWEELEARREEGATVLVVTHDLAAVQRHAGFALVLSGGRKAYFGGISNLLEEYGGRELVVRMLRPPSAALLERLGAHEGVSAAMARGRRLTIRLRGGESLERSLLRMLVDEEELPDSWEHGRSSIELAFHALTGGDVRKGGGGGGGRRRRR